MAQNTKGPLPFRSVLIFGGAGFIGSNWAQRLLSRTDAHVHVFDNLSRPGVRYNLAELRKTAGSSKRLKVTVGDIRDAELVRKAVQGATEIYHFAAQVAVTTSVDDPRADFEVNTVGTLNILEAARNCGHKPSVLFTSTNKVYGHLELPAGKRKRERSDTVSESQPLDFYSPYGCSKGAADQYVRDYARMFGIPTVVFRMSCIAGPHQFGNEDQGWVAHFLYSALRGQEITVYGDGQQVRDVLCVDDLVRAFEDVRSHREITAGQVYNVGGGLENTVSLLELIEEIRRLTGKRLEYDFQPSRPGDQPIYVTNYSKLQSHTGWRPSLTLSETLQGIHRWWQQHREHIAPMALAPHVPRDVFEDASEVAS